MDSIAKIAAYFKRCYEIDSNSQGILNFLGKQVEDDLFIEHSDWIQGKLKANPINLEWGEFVSKKLALHAKEKALYAGSLFLLGTMHIAGKAIKICAPLLLHPLDLSLTKELAFVKIQEGKTFWNPRFVHLIKPLYQGDEPLENILLHACAKDHLGFDEIGLIEILFQEHFPEIQIDSLEKFPQLLSAADLEDQLKNLPTDHLSVVSAIGIGLAKKSSSSRGLLNELQQITTQNLASKPIQSIFFSKENKSKLKKPTSFSFAPVVLSHAQEGIIHGIHQHHNTVVIGPPGTGKSFTIAAIAADALAHNRKILIAAKTDQAVQVIADKLTYDLGLGKQFIRTGEQQYFRKLKKRFQFILKTYTNKTPDKKRTATLRSDLKKIQKRIKSLESFILKNEQHALKRGELINTPNHRFIHQMKSWFYFRNFEKKSITDNPYSLYYDLLQQRIDLQKEFIDIKFENQLIQLIQKRKDDFNVFDKALRARLGSKKEALFKQSNFNIILEAFPIWLVNAAHVNLVLPLQKHLFDLVIIDEASQCDIASAFPLLSRAKKSVIVGDPRQLRHLSFLSKNVQSQIAKNLQLNPENDQLNYRDQSILDLVANASKNRTQIHFLDEHFRSFPEIIQFSNHEFYNNSLKVMSATPTANRRKSVFLTVTSGKRTKRGKNQIEADLILKQIKEIIDAEQNLPNNQCKSIGILSPFRAQVSHLEKQITKLFSLDQIQRHRLIVGTPYAFQGEERDWMLLSFTIDRNTHNAVFQYLNKEDVFNVSITRARLVQQVYVSMPHQLMKPRFLLTRYLKSIDQTSGEQAFIKDQDLAQTDFTNEVISFLSQHEITEYHEDYLLAGKRIDLVFIYKQKTFCIDFIGYPNQQANAFPLEQYRMLGRMKIPVFPLEYAQWKLYPATCKEALLHFFS